MMYGFGDVPKPRLDSVKVMEDLVSEFLFDVLNKAASVRKAKVKTEDVIHVIRKDDKKKSRVEELLFMQEEIKTAKRAFQESEIPGLDESELALMAGISTPLPK
ncbi:TFIID-18kDa-domain-containing protein [Rozella allomycis CSF55]|uniref:Transcription initiation factor TFIID subunit 13 n=1 Tax=Rozella allomycis (strain CSF55) TaxID=988480 RepID=A0A075B444_ROZAC|nr:Transcription initiation factor IID, 18kDa subunit domain-containing protein [Rozella allomycis CSF55]RKP21483.1 TFIID-18kDa-domain-containing protein [Rozella allomycis CSF55]|eukprot:EPZ35854.1 Transcription initiation factor IID, 18kDa subunit domain-containing protein [Rozella allomycis CSF55]